MGDDYLDMSPEEFQELLTEFLTESDNHLQVLNDKLLEAEDAIKAGTEMSDDDLNAMFRAAHTVKGTAGFISLRKIVELTHEMETILQRVKEREMPLTGYIIDVLFKAFDNLEELFSSLRDKGEEEGDIEENVKLIREVLAGKYTASEEPAADSGPEEAPAPEGAAAETEQEETPSAEEAKESAPINEKYLQQFIVDAEDNIETFNELLLNFEKEKDNVDLVNDLFRCMHTIKGASGIINALKVQKVSHAMENTLSFVREEGIVPPDEFFGILFEGIDMVRVLVDGLRKGAEPDVEIDPLCGKLDKLFSKPAQAEEPRPPAQPSPPGGAAADEEFTLEKVPQSLREKVTEALADEHYVFSIQCEIAAGIQMKNMKLLLIEEKLSKKGILISSVPSSEEIPEEHPDPLQVTVFFCSTINEKEIRSVLSVDGVTVNSIERFDSTDVLPSEKEAPPEPSAVAEKEPAAAKPQEDSAAKPAEKEQKPAAKPKPKAPPKAPSIEISTIRVDSHKIDNLMNLSGELVITRARFSQLLHQFNSAIGSQKELMHAYNELKDIHDIKSKEMKIMHDRESEDAAAAKKMFKTFDEMEKCFHELDHKMAESNNIALIHSLDEVTSSLGKIASDIQTGVMQTRMIPIEGIFTRFKRVVRDISKTLNKDVNLRIEGEETELDKKIVDSLGDPLTHMIRNACDHGIEDDPQDRVKAGKPEVGTVLLRASHKGNSFCIEVGDDGRGLDPDKIAESAIKKEIITPEQAEKLSPKEKMHLVFAPGFSTAGQVTGISGRGVGMDVVKNMIGSVNGIVDIESQVGAGTSFILKIPLTLAIIQALLITIGEETFAFPLESVIEIIKVSNEEIYSIDGTDTVKLRGHALSVVKLEKVIQVEGSGRPDQKDKKVVVITDGEGQIGVVVDSLIGEDEIVIKSLTEHFAGVIGITGASILGDGRIALILDPISIIRESNR